MIQDSYYRSAYVKMCQKRNNDRKELIERIKKADLFVVYLCIRHMDAMAQTVGVFGQKEGEGDKADQSYA